MNQFDKHWVPSTKRELVSELLRRHTDWQVSILRSYSKKRLYWLFYNT